jgi:hypothetical protein
MKNRGTIPGRESAQGRRLNAVVARLVRRGAWARSRGDHRA